MIDSEYRGSLTPDQQQRAAELHRFGMSQRKIAHKLDTSYGKVRGFMEWLLEDSGAENLGGPPRYGALLELGLKPPPKGPAILVYDIETTPTLIESWSPKSWPIDVVQDSYMLCFSYKWLGQKGTDFVSIFQDPDFIPGEANDSYVVERLGSLFDHADISIAHNGDRFDLKKFNARAIINGFGPVSPMQTIDTLRESKRYFGFYMHSLQQLGRALGLGRKERHYGIELWHECIQGDPEAWALMEKYNRQDVVLLERVYYKIRPWIGTPGKKGHPNLGHWSRGEMTCPKCQAGADKVTITGWHRTGVSEYPSIYCSVCGGYSRLRNRKTQRNDDHVSAL